LADTAHPASLSAPGGGPGRKESLFGDLAALGYGSGPIYDEMVTGDGRLRPHWRTFMSALGPLDSGFMGERWEAAARLLHQNGVTYNIYGDPQGMDRPWPLDLIPLLIPPDEWATIQAGVIQRATLLNRILCDLYGPQDLIRSGRLPPAAPLCRRSGARAGRPLVGAQRPYPDTQRRRLCPGKPGCGQPRPARGIQGLQRPQPDALLHGA
jgi:hypothetical protein